MLSGPHIRARPLRCPVAAVPGSQWPRGALARNNPSLGHNSCRGRSLICCQAVGNGGNPAGPGWLCVLDGLPLTPAEKGRARLLLSDMPTAKCEVLVAGDSLAAAEAIRALINQAAAHRMETLASPQYEPLWAALRQMREQNKLDTATWVDMKTGAQHKFSVLSLPAGVTFPGPDNVQHVLRRPMYARLKARIEQIAKWPTCRPDAFFLLGVPGSGKTVALYDMMYECADDKHAVVWRSFAQPDKLYCFSPTGARVGGLDAFEAELLDPTTLYLCDSIPPHKLGSAVVKATIIVAVPPQRSKDREFNEFMKHGKRLWLQLPTKPEVHAMAQYYNVLEDKCAELLDRWGPVPRHVLQYAADDTAQDLLDVAIRQADPRNLKETMLDYSRADLVSAKLLHVQATDDFRMGHVTFASPYVKLKLFERLQQSNADQAREFVEFATGLPVLGGSAGYSHQGLVYYAMRVGVRLLVRDHFGNVIMLQMPPLGPQPFYSLQDLADGIAHYSQSGVRSTYQGLHFIPGSSSFASVDSVIAVHNNSPALASPVLGMRPLIPSSSSGSGGGGDSSSDGGSSGSGAGASAGVAAGALPLAAEGAVGPSKPSASEAFLIATQLTNSTDHRVAFAGYADVQNITGSRLLMFIVPPKLWASYPSQGFKNMPTGVTRLPPCEQLVATWVPVTAAELEQLKVPELKSIRSAFGLDSEDLKPDLIDTLVGAAVPTRSDAAFDAGVPALLSGLAPASRDAATAVASAAAPTARSAAQAAPASVPVLEEDNWLVRNSTLLVDRKKLATAANRPRFTRKQLKELSNKVGKPQLIEWCKALAVFYHKHTATGALTEAPISELVERLEEHATD